jgi:SAM-dependent methyltransferase
MKTQFLDLGIQPIANRFIKDGETDKEFKYNLSVGFDEDTKLVTHMDYVDPPEMFNEDYTYRGSMSQTMQQHFRLFSARFASDSKVLEIGSNDGVFIKNWNKENALCVEPCKNFAIETGRLGYQTFNKFWSHELSEDIKNKYGKRDIIFSANCICHIPDLDDTFKGVENLLADNGVFIFEDPSLAQMINTNSYDQIYDEHPHVFSVIALKNILERNGLTIIRVDNTDVHGGSNRIWAMKTDRVDMVDTSVQENLDFEKLMGLDDMGTFINFAQKVEQSKKDLIEVLKKCKKLGKKVISYGATSKSTTVFNYCGIDPTLISYVSDTTPEKQNKLTPGSHIPVVFKDKIEDDVDYVYLGAWNFATEIKEKEKDFVNRGGKFITHVPLVKFV